MLRRERGIAIPGYPVGRGVRRRSGWASGQVRRRRRRIHGDPLV